MARPSVKLVLYYKSIGKYAMNVIAGAVDSQPHLADLVIEFPASLDQLIANLQMPSHDITVVGWSFYSPGFVQAASELDKLRQQVSATDIIHLAGGAHASAEPLQTLQAGFDYVAVGEGEQIIVDFMTALRDARQPGSCKGIAWLDGQRLIRNGKGMAIHLDDYPPFYARQRKFGALEITRGCIYACRFCQTPYINKARFRHRSLNNIADNIRIMHHNGLRDFRFLTPTSLSYGSDDETVQLDRIEAMLAAVRDIIGPDKRIFYGTFPSEIRPEHITPAALTILKKYVDNDNLIIGGQSGSQAILDYSRRGHSVEVIEQAVRYSLEAGFLPNVDFLFGMPAESAEDARHSRELARKLADMGAKIHSHSFMPLPGTPLRDAKPGIIDEHTQRQLKSLAARGHAYGSWQQQHRLADTLFRYRKNEKDRNI